MRRWPAAAGTCAFIAALSIVGACGKKGPPLAPFIRIPAAIQTIDARRVGEDVYVTFTVPAQNVDASTPVDIGRVEVFALTAFEPPGRGRFIDDGAVSIATIDVAPAARPGEPPTAPEPGAAVPGVPVTLRDRLTPVDLQAVPRATPAVQGAAETPRGALRRFYMALPFTSRGEAGPAGTVAELPLTRLPDPPDALEVAYTKDMVTLTWDPQGGLIGFLLGRALPPEPPPSAALKLPPPAPTLPEPEGPTFYNVYREIAPDPLALPAAPGAGAPGDPAPVPLNAMPLAIPRFGEPVALDERRRCYVVRTVRGVAPALVESPPSPPACVTPLDVFAPATPADLATIASGDGISLIWEGVPDADLAGYLILRGEAGGDTLTSLTPEPVQETQFTDDTATPGVRYVYHVMAVDSRLPLPNVSAPAIIEETAR